MEVEVAVLGSPSLIGLTVSACGRKTTLNGTSVRVTDSVLLPTGYLTLH